MLRRLWASLIADDPQPSPSFLDQLDGVRPFTGCAALGCSAEPTATYGHGRDAVSVCDTHDPLAASRSVGLDAQQGASPVSVS
jgi:hypothetical protein